MSADDCLRALINHIARRTHRGWYDTRDPMFTFYPKWDK